MLSPKGPENHETGVVHEKTNISGILLTGHIIGFILAFASSIHNKQTLSFHKKNVILLTLDS